MEKINRNRKIFDSYNNQEYNKIYFNEICGGFVVANKRHGILELPQNVIIAKTLADLGEAVELLEDMPHKKSPDASRNSIIWEFKTIANASNVENAVYMALRRAKKQAENILIHINQRFSYNCIYKALEKAITNDISNEIKQIDLLINNELYCLTKEDIHNGSHKKIQKPDLL